MALTHESYCSVLSMDGDEPISGTAMTVKRYIFISWPKKYWARNQYNSEGFPESLTHYLRKLQKEKVADTQLIYRRRQTTSGYSDIYLMPERVVYRNIAVSDIENTLKRYFEGLEDVKYMRTTITSSFIACCTHGKRDNCCAKFGQSVLYELERVAKEKNFDLDVWECTHIGADRLAATAMSFPTNFMYGRMRVENIPQIVDSLIDDLPYPPCFRGRLGTDSLYQVAEAFGHGYTFNNGLKNPEVIVESLNEVGAQEHEARILVRNRKSHKEIARFVLTIEKRLFPTFGDCEAVKANSLKELPRWVVSRSQRSS